MGHYGTTNLQSVGIFCCHMSLIYLTVISYDHNFLTELFHETDDFFLTCSRAVIIEQ